MGKWTETLQTSIEFEFIPCYSDEASKLCKASLILGTSTLPNVVDVKKLKPGTLLVNKFSPPFFDVKEALDRYEKKEIVCIEEGPLELNEACKWRVGDVFNEGKELIYDDFTIMACVLSSIITSRDNSFPAVFGQPSV